MANDATSSWSSVVELMRRDVRELGRDPEHAQRFLQRYHCSTEGLVAQFRRELGLNPHEMLAVGTLWDSGRMTMTQLGQRLPLSRAAVTTMTDRLERLRYVRRVPDAADRRRILLEVTEHVEQEMTRISEPWRQRVSAYVRELDPGTWAQVVDVLADLREMARDEARSMREAPRPELEQSTRGVRIRSLDEGPADEESAPTWW